MSILVQMRNKKRRTGVNGGRVTLAKTLDRLRISGWESLFQTQVALEYTNIQGAGLLSAKRRFCLKEL
jgi:hypothetical protein